MEIVGAAREGIYSEQFSEIGTKTSSPNKSKKRLHPIDSA